MKKIKMLMVFMAVMLTLALVPSTIRAEGDDVATPDYVAQIGDVGYPSLKEAIEAANAGDTIELVADVSEEDEIDISKDLTINLAGHNIEVAKPIGIDGCVVNINGEGEIIENPFDTSPIKLKMGAKDVTLNISEGVVLKGWAGIMVSSNVKNANINIDGAQLYGNRDTSNAPGSGLYVNGLIEQGDNVVININNSTITGINYGMFLSGYTKTTINDSKVGGKDSSTGIEIRAGEVTIDNSTIEGGKGEYSVEANSSGSTISNAALAISQHTTKLPINVTINSGTFTATKALVEVNPQNNPEDATKLIKLEVKDGDFQGDIEATDIERFIKGGTFTGEVDPKYCAAHNMQDAKDKDGHWQECTICGMKENEEEHTWTLKYDGDSHWYVCSCGAKKGEEAHDWWTPENGVEQCRVCPQKKADVKATAKTATTTNVALPKTGVESHISVMPILMATGIVISAIATKKRH